MGYHVIFRQEKGQIKHVYVQEKYELAALPITENTIIYKGEPDWNPVVVKESEEYCNLSSIRYRGSVLAERIFMKQALAKKYMIETLEQNQESFKQYYEVSTEFLNIKRGDFLIRNVRNLEIEVKCKTLYGGKDNQYFYFEKDHLQKHLNMQEYTKTPIILAVYSRSKMDGTPNPEDLYMIDMDRISKLVESGKTKPHRRDWGQAYRIKVKQCMEGFKLIEFYRKKYNIA